MEINKRKKLAIILSLLGLLFCVFMSLIANDFSNTQKTIGLVGIITNSFYNYWAYKKNNGAYSCLGLITIPLFYIVSTIF